MDCICLQNEEYTAEIIPETGANCCRLFHHPSTSDVLRSPRSLRELRGSPNVFGIPLLFPPGRIASGRYTFDGRTYHFPINEPTRGNHIHGMLSGMPFSCAALGRDYAVLVLRVSEESPYLTFPHAFSIVREYRLTSRGLEHRLTVRNEGDRRMPCGVGFHTAFRVPFARAGSAAHCTLGLQADRLILLDSQSYLPKGMTDADDPLSDSLRRGECPATGGQISAVFHTNDGIAVLLDRKAGLQVLYHAGKALAFFVIWNGDGRQGFVCLEPQSWMPDAPNLPYPWEQSGVDALMPGEERLYKQWIGIREI